MVPVLRVTLLTASLLAAPAPGQEQDAAAPDIQWRKTLNFGKVKSQKLSELRGSAVLLEFWGTH